MFLAVLGVAALAAVPSEDALLVIANDSGRGVVERTRAFADLRAVASEHSIPALARLLDDPAWSYSARSVLEVMPGAAAERALLAALESTTAAPLRTGLINSLGNRRSPAAVSALAQQMRAADAMVVESAINALAQIANEPAGEALAAFEPSPVLKSAWADAMVRVADGLPDSSRVKSVALYRTVLAKAAGPQIGAATIGLARRSDEPVKVVITALKSPEPASQLAALSLIRGGEFGRALTDAVAATWPAVAHDLQVQVLSVLYDRGDRAAAPLARKGLAEADPAIRAAAARLLSVLGDSSDAVALLRLMVGAEEPATSARLALARIPGHETTELLLGAFRRGGDARAAALDVLVNRGYRPLVAELLQPDVFADAEFRRPAANAVAVLGTPADLKPALELYKALPLGRRSILENVLRRLAAKNASADDAAVAILAAAETLPVADAGPLYLLAGGIGGDAAFASLSAMLKSEGPERRRIALRALGSWRDPRPAETLLASARAEMDPAVRTVAVQSAITLWAKSAVGIEGAPSAGRVTEAIAGLRNTWAVAQEPGERNAILTALRGLKNPKAAAAAAELEKSVPEK